MQNDNVKFKIIGILLIIFIHAGCAPRITEEEIKKVENFDPQFKVVLSKKREIDLKVSSLQNKIALEKADIEAKISVLRAEFQNKKVDLEAEIAEIKTQLEPERKAIREKIERLNQELKPLEERLASIESMLKDTHNLLKKSQDAKIALQDKARWDNQIRLLETEKAEVQKAIEGLREKIKLYSLELRIIK